MTWSIIAKDPETGAFGIAITTKFFAVGALCPHGAGRIGALATQAFTNPLYGVDGLRLLAEGRSAPEIVAILTAADADRETRQLHVIDRDGRTAAHTGRDCVDWCGHLADEGVSVAGNMLAGPSVIEATLDAYRRGADLPFAERLMNALDAGQAEGGDKRGKQSAALKIWRTEPYPALDLRVDDHAEPLRELRRLHGVAHERFVAFVEAMATRANPSGITEKGWLDRRAREIQEGMLRAGDASA
jgi:uncharacterized Ntn-hydrolase superfamily protein